MTSPKVGWSMFWQVPGQLAAFAFALTELPLAGAAWEARWRLLLAAGALPALAVMPLVWKVSGENWACGNRRSHVILARMGARS